MAGKIHPSGHAGIIIIIFVSLFGMGLPSAMLGAAWPSMFEGLGVPDSYLGVLTTIIMGCSIIGSTISGPLSKRIKTSTILIACTLMFSAPLFGFGLLTLFLLFCIIVLPMGFALGLGESVINNYIATNLGTKYMNWAHCFWGIASTIGPIVLSFGMVLFGTWRFGFSVMGLGMLIVLLLMVVTLPRWRQSADSRASEIEISKVNLIDTLRFRGVKLSLATVFSCVAMEITTIIWGSTYLVMVKGMPPELAARWIALFSIGLTGGRFLAGFMSIKLSNHQLIRFGVGVLAVGIVLILFPLGSSWYLVGFLLMGIGNSPLFPCVMQNTPLIVGEAHSQAVIGLQVACGYICGAVVPALFGIMAVYTGYAFFPIFIACLLAIMLTIIEIQYRRTPSLRGHR